MSTEKAINALKKIAGNNIETVIISTITSIISGYFYLNENHSKAIVCLLIYLILVILVIIIKIKNTISNDVNSDDNYLKILLIYSEDKVNSTFINESTIEFLLFHLSKLKPKRVSSLNKKLKDNPDIEGICIIWNDEIEKHHDEYFLIIEKWLLKNKSKPFIIMSDSTEDEKSDCLKFYSTKYKVLSMSDNVPLYLLSRSISRTKSFVSISNIWKYSFISIASLILVCGSVVMYNDLGYRPDISFIEKVPETAAITLNNSLSNDSTKHSEIREKTIKFLNDYIDFKEHMLRSKLNDETIEISFWRNKKQHPDSLYRINSSSGKKNQIPIKKSVGGCACKNNEVIVGWSANDIPTDDTIRFFWSKDTGKKIHRSKLKNAEYCFFNDLGSDKINTLILSISSKIDNSSMYNVVCIKSDNKKDMILKSSSNNLATEYLFELNSLTTIIPSKVLFIDY